MTAFQFDRPRQGGARFHPAPAPSAWLLGWVLLTSGLSGKGFGQDRIERVTVIGPQGREAIPISLLANIPMLPLDELDRFLGSSTETSADAASATFSVGERSAVVSSGRSMVRVGVEGKLVLLSAPITARGGHWFVPLDFLKKVVPLVSGQRITYEEATRLLVIGEGFPRLTVSTFPYPGYTRIVLESSSPIEYQVAQAGDRVRVAMPVGYLESDFVNEELQDGVVQSVMLTREDDGYALSINLGDRFGTLKAFQLESPSRMVLDLFRSRVPADAEIIPPPTSGMDPTAANTIEPPLPSRPPDRIPPADLTPRVLRAITLDPGHGGPETGATGSGGLQEKDVTLAIARRLGQLLETRLGVRVLLTRDSDTYLSLDERTAIANNNKSDLFLSIHANASPRPNASGSEVYYLSYEASDDESRRLAAAENANGFSRSVGNSDLDFILWDMAQAAYLNESATLAELLQEELQAYRTDERNRGIKQAPFRVLMGATMASALIEIGFITNPEEEGRLGSGDYQDQLAQAIYRGVVKYKERFDRQESMGSPLSSGRP